MLSTLLEIAGMVLCVVGIAVIFSLTWAVLAAGVALISVGVALEWRS